MCVDLSAINRSQSNKVNSIKFDNNPKYVTLIPFKCMGLMYVVPSKVFNVFKYYMDLSAKEPSALIPFNSNQVREHRPISVHYRKPKAALSLNKSIYSFSCPDSNS